MAYIDDSFEGFKIMQMITTLILRKTKENYFQHFYGTEVYGEKAEALQPQIIYKCKHTNPDIHDKNLLIRNKTWWFFN